MNNDLVNEFLVASYEDLDRLDRALVALEQDPSNRDTLASIFRTIHNIKGSCGFLGFSKLGAVTHIGESLLSRLRDGQLPPNPEVTSALLAFGDAARQMLADIKTSGHESDADYSELIETLTRLRDGKGEPAVPGFSLPSGGGNQTQPTVSTAAALSPSASLAADTAELRGMPLLPGSARGIEIPLDGAPSTLEDGVSVARQPEGNCSPHPSELPAEREQGEPQPAGAAPAVQAATQAAGVSDSDIRVAVGRLDRLMNLVGELVLARNQIQQFSTTQEDPAFIGSAHRLSMITSELQDAVTKTRLQPIGTIWSRFPRIIRDLASACGKQVRLETEGRETELDKAIIEAIRDPLTHMVRNAVDHGIETPEERAARGKPPEGRLFLGASHENGQVTIEVSDDGAGINPDSIRQKAVRLDLLTTDQASCMSDGELVDLVFLPGFSTAENVTHLSGRGVGMDVVKSNIEKIGGTIDVQSQPGHGTTVRIQIPLTLTIVPALVVTSGGNRYAIPQANVVELVRLPGGQAGGGIEMFHGTPVFRRRGCLLPLLYLTRELMAEGEASPPDSAGSVHRAVPIIVLEALGRKFGLVVEAISDIEEIVVKPLDKRLKGRSAFIGVTIMGDGKVALILDVPGLARRTGLASEEQDRPLVDRTTVPGERSEQCQALLLVGVGEDRRLAIPLSLVARLEEFPRSAVERASGREVVQYRGRIMPLIRLPQLLAADLTLPADELEHLQVVVCSDQGRDVGLVVDRILDIVEASRGGASEAQPLSGEAPGPVSGLAIQQSNRDGILGSVVIQQRVTDLLDLEGALRAAGSALLAPATPV